METGEAEEAAARDVEARVEHLCRFYVPAAVRAAVGAPDCADGPRVGFIGSESAYEALRPHVRLTLLTRANWRAHLHARTLDAVVIAPAPLDLARQWAGDLFAADGLGGEIESLLAACPAHGIGRFAWLECGAEAAARHAPLCARVDTVLCSTGGLAERLRRDGVKAEAVGTAAPEPAWRAFADDGGRGDGPLRIACTGLASATRRPELADILASLIPFGLELFEAAEELTRQALSSADPLREGIRGCLLPGELSGLFASIDVLVQADAEDGADGTAWRHAISAATSGALVAVLGQPGHEDPRPGFAHFFEDPSDLRAFLSRLRGDGLERERLARISWRAARHLQRTTGPAPALRRATGYGEEQAPVRLSMVAVPPDAGAAGTLLEDFRARDGGDHELLLVGREDRDAGWTDLRAGLAAGERAVRVPGLGSDGAALLLGASLAGGDYVVIPGRGVRFGARLLSDLALALSPGRPHVAIVPELYAASDAGGELLRRAGPATVPAAVAIRRDCVAALVEPRDTLEAALSAMGGTALRLGLSTVVTDGLNALRVLDDDSALSREGWRAADTAHGPEGVFV